MPLEGRDVAHGLEALRRAVARLLPPPDAVLVPLGPARPAPRPGARTDRADVLWSEALAPAGGPGGPGGRGEFGDADQATSSEESEADRTRLIALVELARTGDADAFGQLFDHYQPSVYRFLFYRTRSAPLAEDLTSETFFRALRNMTNFRWQGKDFGAWLMTIARNLAHDHFKAGRTRLELTTEDMGAHDRSAHHDGTEDSPEDQVLAGLTNDLLLEALTKLPDEQRDCLVMRFLQGMSIAETAAVLGKSDGAVKQLQLRGVRNLAKLMPEGMRD